MERPYTTSVDLWAAGVVTYEFLLGHSPFRRYGLLLLLLLLPLVLGFVFLVAVSLLWVVLVEAVLVL